MAQSDIFLKENRVSVVGGDGSETRGGREAGDLEVTVGKGEAPSVTLNADRANVTLGGGSGEANAPEGDVKLLDRNGTNRVQVTAETTSGGRTPANVGDQTVWVDGGTGRIRLAGPGASKGTIEPSIELNGESGTVSVAGSGGTGEAVTLADEPGAVSPGGVNLYGAPPIVGFGANPSPDETHVSGVAELYDRYGNKGVEIQGGSASLTLGYSYVEMRNAPTGELPVTGGRGGKLLIDDGNAIGVQNSAVFEVRAASGTLQISAHGHRVLEIDPGEGENGRLRIPEGWSVDDDLPPFQFGSSGSGSP